MQHPTFHLPMRPYGPIDALNRRAAAVGTPRYAQGATGADYNGHRVTLEWNSYRRYYVATYMWAGPRVIARGTFADCLRGVLREHNRGALGSCAIILPREDDAEAIELCEQAAELVAGDLPRTPSWHTWRHSCAAESARDSANPGMLVPIFDWELMQAAADRPAYECALRSKYGRVYG